METDKKKYYYIKIAGYFLLILGLVLLIVTVINFISAKRFMKNSNITSGIVVRNEVKGTGNLLQNISYILYEVDKKQYECFNTSRTYKFRYNVGDSVIVRYDIGDPRNAFVDTYKDIYWASNGLIKFVLIFLIMGFVGVIFTNWLVNISKNLRYGE